jgi:hypothetical protein
MAALRRVQVISYAARKAVKEHHGGDDIRKIRYKNMSLLIAVELQ